MKLETIIVGALSTNCYLLKDGQSAIVIDPGAEGLRIYEHLKDYKVEGILLTHGHMDHIEGIPYLAGQFKCPIYLHKDELGYIKSFYPQSLIKAFLDIYQTRGCFVEDAEIISLGNLQLKAIKVAGHTDGSLCFYEEREKLLFSGDTLFADSIGRVDMYKGSSADLSNNIKEHLLILPHDVKVYPGHGEESTIGKEKKYNYFVGEERDLWDF